MENHCFQIGEPWPIQWAHGPSNSTLRGMFLEPEIIQMVWMQLGIGFLFVETSGKKCRKPGNPKRLFNSL